MAAPSTELTPQVPDVGSAQPLAPIDGPPPEPTVDTPPPAAGHLAAVIVGYGGRRVRVDEHGSFSGFVEIDANGGDDANLLRGVTFGDGLFVAVGTATYTSPNGIDWQRQANTPNWLGNAAYVNGVFVAAGGYGLRVVSTDRAQTWTVVSGGGGSIDYRDVVSNGQVAVAGGATGNAPSGEYAGCPSYAAMLTWTSDGTNWTHVQLGQSKPCGSTAYTTVTSLAHGAGHFVGAGYGGAVFTSVDGKAWNEQTLAGSGQPTVSFGSGQFWLSYAGGQSYTSADGTTWQNAGPSTIPVVGFAGGFIGLVRESTQIYFSANPSAWGPVAFQPTTGSSGFLRAAVGIVP